jgi:hypothetical protein
VKIGHALSFFSVLLLFGCVRDPVSEVVATPSPSLRGVYVLNEGLFGHGNSTLSYFDLQTSQLTADVFFAANNKHLGDVGNSIVIRGTRAYIVVNNSDKIEVIDISNNLNVGTISVGSGRSPRQLALLNDSVGLVTNLYDASVLLLDLKNMTTSQRIPVGQNPDGLAVSAGRAFVANSGLGSGRTVSVIDLQSLAVIKTVTVADNPVDVQTGPDGMVHVLCAGSYGDYSNPNDDTPAKIVVIEPGSGAVVDSILIGGHAFKLAIGADGYGYVPGSDSVIVVDTRSRTVRGGFVRGSFYGVAVEQSSGDVYLSDAKNYVTPGTVFVYASNRQLRMQFDAGIIPGSFAFKRLN